MLIFSCDGQPKIKNFVFIQQQSSENLILNSFGRLNNLELHKNILSKYKFSIQFGSLMHTLLNQHHSTL